MDSLVEFFPIRHEPDLIASVRHTHKIPESAALSHIAGDVAGDRHAPPVRYEFLNDLPGNASSEPEEIVVEPPHGNQDQIGAMLDRLSLQFYRIGCVLRQLGVGFFQRLQQLRHSPLQLGIVAFND